jgi:chromosome segregation ATPase
MADTHPVRGFSVSWARSFLSSVALPVAVATGILTVSPAHAQTARSGGAPNAQLLQQMQQLASERTSLQAENARMKKELEDLRKERDQLKKSREAVDVRLKSDAAALARSSADRDSTEQQLAQSKARMQELVGKFRETLQTLRELEAEGNSAKQSLAARDTELKTCVDRNVALYHLNDEVLTRFEKQGLLSRMAQAEPFTRIKRVQLENLIDGYKARAEDQRAAAPTPLPDGATRPIAPAPAPALSDSTPAVPPTTQPSGPTSTPR